MFSINKKCIRRLESDIKYRRGCYKNSVEDLKVYNIEINSEYLERINKEIYSIVAEVSDEKNNQVVNCEIYFTEEAGIEQMICTCGFCDSYDMCPHVTAVISEFINNPYEIIDKSEDERVNEIIESLEVGIVGGKIQKEILKLKPKLIYEGYNKKEIYLELKIGKDKLYIVKNMKNFLEKVKYKNDIMEFGKNFTFNPYTQDLDHEDKNLITLLIDIYDSQMILDSQYEREYTFLKGKRALLTENQLKRFFSIYSDKQFDFQIGTLKLEDIQIKKEKVPLEFDIMQNKINKEIYVKHISDMPISLTNDGKYFYYEENIYENSKEFINMYATLYNVFIKNKNNLITFKDKYIDKLGTYILPILNKVGKEVNVDDGIRDNFVKKDLKTKIYLDEIKGKVIANIKFFYGDAEQKSDEKKKRKDGAILIRDVEKENISKIFFINCGFKIKENRFVLEDDEKIIEFLSEGVPKLQDMGEVYYSDAFKNIKVHTQASIYSTIKLNDEDLLEFTFGAEDIDRKELKNILNAVREKKKYYRLKKGGFVSLEGKKWNDISNLVDYLDIKDSDIAKDTIMLSKYQAMYLEETSREKDMEYIKKNQKFVDLVSEMKDVKKQKFIVPKTLDSIMRNYQKLGFKWFKTLDFCGFGGILADEMGLGKTIQAIAFILSELEENNKRPNIVISPTSLVYNWKSEIEKFAPSLNVLVICGTKDERKVQIKEIDKYDVILTTYPLIRRDVDMYKEIKFNYCILDEAQQIKNPNSLNAKSVKEIKAKNRFVLTGTPIENSLTELWSIFDFIMPGYLLSHGKFMKKYERPIVKDKNTRALEELNNHIQPFIMRRLKKDVMKELPPKVEHNILVEMTDEQKKIYLAYLQNAKEEMKREIKDKGFNNSKIKILSLLTRLRQICCDPSVFIENFQGTSGKIDVLENLLQQIIEGGHKILIFSQFTTVLKNIVKTLKKNQFEYLYLDGSTKVKDRGDMVDEFNKGDTPIFLISLKAGGTGLNLTGADTVIHFDPWWNPAVEDQASDRAHRIGQKKSVEVIRLITRGTIEEKIQKLQETKKHMIKNVMEIEGKDINVLSTMDKEEIEELFKLED